MGRDIWLEGAIAVEAALQSGNRPVHTVFIQHEKWDGPTRRLLKAADAADVRVQRVKGPFIVERTTGNSHGGIIARVGRRKFTSLADLVSAESAPLVAMLDGVEDPFNFGYAVRALYAAGVDGLVIRRRSWLSASGVVARASAGASERIAVAVSEGPAEAAAFFKGKGLTIACTSKKRATPLHEADLTRPMFLLIGGEKRGITRSVFGNADLRLNIPYGRRFGFSLGTAAASAVFAFEIMRQRNRMHAGTGQNARADTL